MGKVSYTLIDYFNGFQNLKRVHKTSAGTQTTYYAILAEFNLRRFPAELVLTVRDLKELAGLKSVSTVHESLNVLKNLKLIDFWCGEDGVTRYALRTEHVPNTNRTRTEQQANTGRTTGERAVEDNSALKQVEKDRKTERRRAREESVEYEQPEDSGIDLSEY